MSSRRAALRLSRSLFVLVALSLTAMVGCWEQWSNDWFPQMKWQKAVQAFEEVTYADQKEGFTPPEGAVPIDGGEAPVSNIIDAASDVLVNPRVANLDSIQNGRVQFERYCSTCHGLQGLGDGPVSVTGEINGPLAGVLAVAGPTSIARIRSDGHIYTTIRYGRRRMPNYSRIQSDDRWDIVNYLRYLENPNRSLQ
ncbi:MAG: cytochrome c [Deltaproteobacteria bacterium]|nr:cytochrome c [Deltaproteobacteria bacterium]